MEFPWFGQGMFSWVGIYRNHKEMDAQLSLKFSENEMQSCLQFVPFSIGDPSVKQPVSSVTT